MEDARVPRALPLGRVHAIIGGFHLTGAKPEVTVKTVAGIVEQLGFLVRTALLSGWKNQRNFVLLPWWLPVFFGSGVAACLKVAGQGGDKLPDSPCP